MRQHETIHNNKQVHTMEGSQNIVEKGCQTRKHVPRAFPSVRLCSRQDWTGNRQNGVTFGISLSGREEREAPEVLEIPSLDLLVGLLYRVTKMCPSDGYTMRH